MRARDRATLIDLSKTCDTGLQENGATGPIIFGPRGGWPATSRQRTRSVHRLRTGTKPPNMFRLMKIQQRISQALGIPVTITMRNALQPLMKESIEREAIRVS